MKAVLHNLPPAPYKKFFGRSKDIQNIYEAIVKGQTYIASIDGVGGIGKSALAYYFCQEMIVDKTIYYDDADKVIKQKSVLYRGESDKPAENLFEYVVWVTAKDSVFDSFSVDNQKIKVENKFLGVETLFDSLLEVTDFPKEGMSFEQKKEFFEEVVKSESILFILDNLENIADDDFFKYVKDGFNQFAKLNPKELKILTTSRKRKKIIDNPIDIEGLSTPEAVEMLKYLAANNPNKEVTDILNADHGNNVRLVEKLGRIPLMIEFAVGRMSNGKSRGDIDAELMGYPSLSDARSTDERKRIMADIIDFQFSNMYEDLTEKQKQVFKTIVILQKNRYKNEEPPSFDKLMIITDFSRDELEEILNTLLDNKLITETNNQQYATYPMANNLAMQVYPDMDNLEAAVMARANEIKDSADKVDLFLNSVNADIGIRDYEAAEKKLLSAIDIFHDDHRLYHALADLDLKRGRKPSAHNNFNKASSFDPSNSKIWHDWIMMYFNTKQYPTAVKIARDAIKQTKHEVSIVNLLMEIYSAEEKETEWRKVVDDAKKIYLAKNRSKDDPAELIKLLRNWKSIEFKRYKNSQPNNYLEASDQLIIAIDDPYIKLELLQEELDVAQKSGNKKRLQRIHEKITTCKNQIFTVPLKERRSKIRHFIEKLQTENAKKEAQQIFRWITHPNLTEEQHAWIIDTFFDFFSLLEKEEKFDEIIQSYDQNFTFCKYEPELEKIYSRAKNELAEVEKKKMAAKIFLNIQDAEIYLRKIIMFEFGFDDNRMMAYIKTMPSINNNKTNVDALTSWGNIRNKSQAKKNPLIHFSTFHELKTIYKSILPSLTKKLKSKTNRDTSIETVLEKISQILDRYIHEERNLMAHALLMSRTISQLNEVMVDADRVKRYTYEINSYL
jgi:tetratricopeptide (TPR) repeat protein